MRKLWITTILFGLIVVGAGVGYLGMYRWLSTMMTEISRLDAEMASRHKEQQQAGSLIVLLRNHSADFDRLRAQSISRTNPVSFLKEFETLAALTHTAVTIDLDGGDTSSDRMGFHFNIVGAEKNVAAMLALIEHAPYLLTIDSISTRRVLRDQGGTAVSGQNSGAALSSKPELHMRISVHVKAAP